MLKAEINTFHDTSCVSLLLYSCDKCLPVYAAPPPFFLDARATDSHLSPSKGFLLREKVTKLGKRASVIAGSCCINIHNKRARETRKNPKGATRHCAVCGQ